MGELQVFSNAEFGSVRSLMVNGEPYFVGKDVAEILGYSNSRKALIDHVDEEDKTDGVTIRDSIGREQMPVLTNESGLYSLILSSRLPAAKRFKRWVTSEVLLPAAFDDRILTKSNHKVILMIEKNKKHIIHSAENRVLNIDQKDIEQYFSEVKDAVEKDNYRLDRNARRQDNINLFLDYVIDEAKAKEIILSLTVMDFSEILQNEHKGYEYRNLYVFGKDVDLLERNGTEEKTVSLYIKFNKLENCFVIVISFHEQKHPLTYYFR